MITVNFYVNLNISLETFLH